MTNRVREIERVLIGSLLQNAYSRHFSESDIRPVNETHHFVRASARGQQFQTHRYSQALRTQQDW